MDKNTERKSKSSRQRRVKKKNAKKKCTIKGKENISRDKTLRGSQGGVRSFGVRLVTVCPP